MNSTTAVSLASTFLGGINIITLGYVIMLNRKFVMLQRKLFGENMNVTRQHIENTQLNFKMPWNKPKQPETYQAFNSGVNPDELIPVEDSYNNMIENIPLQQNTPQQQPMQTFPQPQQYVSQMRQPQQKRPYKTTQEISDYRRNVLIPKMKAAREAKKLQRMQQNTSPKPQYSLEELQQIMREQQNGSQ